MGTVINSAYMVGDIVPRIVDIHVYVWVSCWTPKFLVAGTSKGLFSSCFSNAELSARHRGGTQYMPEWGRKEGERKGGASPHHTLQFLECREHLLAFRASSLVLCARICSLPPCPPSHALLFRSAPQCHPWLWLSTFPCYLSSKNQKVNFQRNCLTLCFLYLLKLLHARISFVCNSIRS